MMSNVRSMEIAIISGGFDPIHTGHLDMIHQIAEEYENLICIVNSDDFLLQKKGYVVQDWLSRMQIMKSIQGISEVIPCIDRGDSVCKTLEYIRMMHPGDYLIFCNGGDRESSVDIPEAAICDALNIECKFGYGEKTASSSEIIRKVVQEINK